VKKFLFAAAAALALPSVIAPASAASPEEQAAAREMFARIISMRTSKGNGQVPAMAAYLAGELRKAGFSGDDIYILPKDETAALVVRYRGDASSGKKPILFLAHMDVVDARPEDWELNPFELTEKDGYFFGRGVTDNKYGVLNLTQTFIRLKKEGFTPSRDLVMAFTGDEETGMVTTKMLAYDRKDLTDAEFALNSDAGGGMLSSEGKPVGYGVQAAEKTYATFEITARNQGGHSSQPRKDNAIYDLARALDRIEKLEFPVMSNAITLADFAATGPALGGELGEAMTAFAKNPKDKKAAKVLAGDPGTLGQTRTTCVATMLNAGHAENALPQRATATVNCRIFPGVEVETVKTTLAAAIDNPALEITTLDDPSPSPASEMRDDVTAALSKAVHARFADLSIGAYQESGGTDGKHFRGAGVPTLAMSAIFMKSDDMFAHGLNERLPVNSFYGGLDHWMIIVKELAAPKSSE
jgi:acetylornithine deacetylase/succinyl-diaminopimelate desuccinylase-like protein